MTNVSMGLGTYPWIRIAECHLSSLPSRHARPGTRAAGGQSLCCSCPVVADKRGHWQHIQESTVGRAFMKNKKDVLHVTNVAYSSYVNMWRVSLFALNIRYFVVFSYRPGCVFSYRPGCVFSYRPGCVFSCRPGCVFSYRPGCVFSCRPGCVFSYRPGCVFSYRPGCVFDIARTRSRPLYCT